MMADLFGFAPQPSDNLLPYDGTVNDYGIVFPSAQADVYLRTLLAEIDWRHDEAVVFGQHRTTARQVAWYGERAFSYTYSGIRRTALLWQPLLLDIKQMVETRLAAVSPAQFNSCLLNLYADGSQGMAWHSDDEKELVLGSAIASLSFGASRKFAFKHKRTQEKRKMLLQHGQLIVMRGNTQRHWLHAVMKSTKVHEPRVSLTFRVMAR